MSRETNWERYFGTPERVIEYFRDNDFGFINCSVCPLEIDGRCFAFEGNCTQRLLQWLESDAETNEFEPCPFCGGKWQHIELSTEGVSCIRHVRTITCSFCGAQIERDGNISEVAEERAIEAWNTRA